MNNTLKHFLLSQKKIDILKITLILLITSSLAMLFISTEQAFALPTITWSNPAGYTINEGDNFLFTPANTFTVDADDIALVGNGPDTIDVLISSSTGDSTTLILSESLADDGTFTNTNLIFTHGNTEFQVTDTATITIEDNCFSGSGNCDPNAIDTLSEALSTGVTIWSSSDPGGIRIDLTETGPNTGIFTRTLHFSTIGSDPATATIFVAPGDVIIIMDQVTSAYVNGLIIPTPSDVGSIQTEIGGTVTATYNGVSVPVGIFDDGAPGRGGGGAVRPGLVLNFIFGGSGAVLCSGDCIKPTLGLDLLMNRIVEKGFSYNGHAVDVQEYYTPYPLITSNVGQKNVALLKIYDNGGPENIRHVSLAFGLSKGGQSISEGKAIIKWDKSFSGLETLTVKDPENALQNVAVKTEIGNCSQLGKQQCLIVSISHTFRQSLGFNIVGTDVWDSNRNSKTNFYNEGIAIVGESLNPPKQYSVIDSLGYPALVTQTDKNAGIDEDGNFWLLDNQIWIKEVVQEQLQDPIGLHGLDRNNNLFKSYINGQRFLAQESFRNIVNGKITQNPEFSNLENYRNLPSNFDESEYEKLLQQRILNEQEIAEKRFSILYDIKHNY